MSNKTVLVPVDPKGFGCGLLLGLIIRYWRQILVASLLIFGCIAIAGIVNSISEANQAKIVATQNALSAMQQATSFVNAIEDLKHSGTISIDQKRNVWYHGNGYYVVQYVKFEEDRFLVYIDLDVEYGGLHERSCIRYSTYDDEIKPLENHFEQLSDTHFIGFQTYSYADLKPGFDYRFSPDCDVTESTKIFLFRLP